MKKESKNTNFSMKKRRLKGWVFLLVLVCLPSSTPFFFSEGFSQDDDSGFYNESGTGEVGTPDKASIPTPSSGGLNSNSFMKAASKFKGFVNAPNYEGHESTLEETGKKLEEKKLTHEKNIDSTNTKNLKDFEAANKDLGKQGWRKVKSAGKAASAANILKLKHDRKRGGEG